MFNGCFKCDTSFVHEWANNKVDYTSCVSKPDSITNCAAYEPGQNDTGEC